MVAGNFSTGDSSIYIDGRRVVSQDAAAAILGVKPAQVLRWLKAGKLDMAICPDSQRTGVFADNLPPHELTLESRIEQPPAPKQRTVKPRRPGVNVNIEAAILEALRELTPILGEVYSYEIAAEIDRSARTARYHLGRLEARGLVQRPHGENSGWALVLASSEVAA